jgi:hypothetical protein
MRSIAYGGWRWRCAPLPRSLPTRHPPGVVAPQATATDQPGCRRSPATLRENSYFYQSFGTTDPFRSLLAGDFEPKLQELVDLHTVQMVGVVWENDEIAAMLQDAQGFGYTLCPAMRSRTARSSRSPNR